MSPRRRQFVTTCLAGAGAALAGCTSYLPGTAGDPERIDDWQYDPENASGSGGGLSLGGNGGGGYTATAGDAAAPDGASMDLADDAGSPTGGDRIGLSAGGAADVTTFRRNVREGYLPIPESVTYEGLFHEYYFDTGGDGSCESLFCPTYTPAASPDPLSGEDERFLSVGLDSGVAQSAFERPNLNLVVVLDISGSMDSQFDDYHYDPEGDRTEVEGDTSRRKIEVARDALASMTHRLRPEDRLGVVLFDDEGYLAKPLRRVEETDMDAIRGHIREDVRADGGTNVAAGLELAREQMAEYEDADPETYENRSILLTDAQINVGTTDDNELRDRLETEAERGHHTSVVGIGVDFNAELVESITEVRGANYYSVSSADEFERRVDEQFEYVVTPLVYDLSLELDAEDVEIRRVYGSTAADEATGELMHVRTLFPSPRTDGEAKGGVVLVELDGEPATDDLELTASWETRDGRRRETTESISFPVGDEFYGSDAVRKAVLLARHATLLRNWAAYERDEELVEDAEGIAEPPADDRLGRWELQSEPLTVSDRYESRLREFREHLAAERAAIGDDDLEREAELLDQILAASGP